MSTLRRDQLGDPCDVSRCDQFYLLAPQSAPDTAAAPLAIRGGDGWEGVVAGTDYLGSRVREVVHGIATATEASMPLRPMKTASPAFCSLPLPDMLLAKPAVDSAQITWLTRPLYRLARAVAWNSRDPVGKCSPPFRGLCPADLAILGRNSDMRLLVETHRTPAAANRNPWDPAPQASVTLGTYRIAISRLSPLVFLTSGFEPWLTAR